MISHLIAVFIGATFVGAPIGIFVMALIQAGRREQPEPAAPHLFQLDPIHTTVHDIPLPENMELTILGNGPDSEGIDWSVLGV